MYLVFVFSLNIVPTDEISNYSSFLKQYKDDVKSILGKLQDYPDPVSINPVSYYYYIIIFYRNLLQMLNIQNHLKMFFVVILIIKIIIVALLSFIDCINVQTNLKQCFFMVFMQKEVYTNILPQLLFLNDRSYPSSLPPDISRKLLLNLGRDIEVIQKASEIFSSCFSLLVDILGQLSLCDVDSNSDFNLLLRRKQKVVSSSIFNRNTSKSNQQSSSHLYFHSSLNQTIEMLLSQLSSFLYVVVHQSSLSIQLLPLFNFTSIMLVLIISIKYSI